MAGRTNTPFAEIELIVPGMMCEGCADTIRSALMALKGVEHAKVNAWRKRVRVRYAPTGVNIAELQAALASIGYNAEESSR